jgi:hypothetical protein
MFKNYEQRALEIIENENGKKCVSGWLAGRMPVLCSG